MKRYDLITNYRCGSAIEEMEPSDDGEWVRYEDVEAQIAEVKSDLDAFVEHHLASEKAFVALQDERDKLKVELEQWVALQMQKDQ